jgi:hypothetical protein
MKESTKSILAKNQELLKHLVRTPQKNKRLQKKRDEVDTFFNERITVPIQGESQVVKNVDNSTKISEHELTLIKNFRRVNHFTKEAWNARSISELTTCTRATYSTMLPNGVEFRIIRGQAKGVGVFGNLQIFSDTVRSMEIPINEQSILRDTFLTGTAYKGPLLPSNWNNFIANRLMEGKICPEVIALPIFDDSGVKSVILSCDIQPSFSKFIAMALEQFVLNIKGIAQTL